MLRQWYEKEQKKNRSIKELKQDIRDGFYGDDTRCGRSHPAVDSRIISRWTKKCHEHMNNEIKEVLGIHNKTIDNLWNENSTYKATDPFIRMQRSYKTLEAMSKQFKIVIDNEEQCFV